MPETTDTVSPFSCGSQYIDWQNSNCCTCEKMAPDDCSLDEIPCEIERALVWAQFQEGRIPLAIADKMGHANGRYNWACREHDPPFINVRPDGTVDRSVTRPEPANPSED